MTAPFLAYLCFKTHQTGHRQQCLQIGGDIGTKSRNPQDIFTDVANLFSAQKNCCAVISESPRPSHKPGDKDTNGQYETCIIL